MLSSGFFPKPTGDVGRDRNARTLQFSCLLFASALGIVGVLDTIDGQQVPLPILLAAAGLFGAAAMNRAGRPVWAARTAILVLMWGAILLVFEAHDGFRSHAMLVFPGLLLISVMLLDRASYLTTAGILLVAVAALGIAETHGLTKAEPGIRTPTSYDSIFYVELTLAVFAMIGSRIANDDQRNVFDLRTTVDELSKANLELRQSAEALRENEQEQVSIYNAVRDVIFHLAVEPEGRFRFLSVNAAFLRVTGLSREMVVGKTLDEVIGDPSLTMVLSKYRQAIEERTTVLWEETSDYPTGRLTGEVSVVPVFDGQGGCTHLIGSVHDITERKRAEAKLRESEERFRRVFEEGPLGLGLVGRDYRFLKVNGALCEMLDYSEDELLLKSFVDITHPDDVRDDIELAKALFRRDIPFYRIQKRYLKKNGEVIWINLTASVIRDPDGEPLYGLAMVEDVTEVKRTQEQAFARQKLETVGTLAGGIAHDFNNLLGGVLAQAELGLEEHAAGSEPEAELRVIRDVALRGSEIVRELMVYAGKETAVVGLVDVSQIVEEMLELLKVSVSKQAVVEANLGKDLPPVRANAAELRRVVMNLVTNASEAMEGQNGVVCVNTSRVMVGRNSGAISDHLTDGDYLQLEVTDTGRGLSLETQAKVFEPFFTTKSAGHGLGLAVVDGIVRGLGGSIHLMSAPGKGATFQILLPFAEREDPATKDAVSGPKEPTSPSQPRTVLLVEDESPLRLAVGEMLRRRGFKVFDAGDGLSAISLLRANAGKIDLILLDLTIPGASSREVVEEAAHVRPDIRVILTSAYSQEMVRNTVSAPQIRSFIRKPFRLGDLVKTLENVLAEG
jgi:PAS domain S-box-containing protein